MKDGIDVNALSSQLESALNHFDEFTPSSKKDGASSTKTVQPQKQIETLSALPYNCYIEEDGSVTYELPVPGNTSKTVEINRVDDGINSVFVIDVPDRSPEKIREIVLQNFKEKIHVEIAINSKYNIDKASAKVENGLLTINVPAKEVKKTKIEVC